MLNIVDWNFYNIFETFINDCDSIVVDLGDEKTEEAKETMKKYGVENTKDLIELAESNLDDFKNEYIPLRDMKSFSEEEVHYLEGSEGSTVIKEMIESAEITIANLKSFK